MEKKNVSVLSNDDALLFVFAAFKRSLLGTLQSLFLLVGFYNFAFRLCRGIFTLDLLELAFLSSLAVLLGLAIGNRIIDLIDSRLMSRLTYILIGLSGLLTLVTTLFY